MECKKMKGAIILHAAYAIIISVGFACIQQTTKKIFMIILMRLTQVNYLIRVFEKYK
jgi:hypothetical protein